MTYFSADVHTDLPTSQGKGLTLRLVFYLLVSHLFIEAGSKHDVRGSDAWDSFTEIINFLTSLLTVVSLIALILNLSRSTGGPIFPIICFINPIVNVMFTRELWDKGAFCSPLSNLQA